MFVCSMKNIFIYMYNNLFIYSFMYGGKKLHKKKLNFFLFVVSFKVLSIHTNSSNSSNSNKSNRGDKNIKLR